MTNAKRKIVVVDDEPLIRMGTADTLRDGGFEVLEANNASDALCPFCEGQQVAALVSDVQMPGAITGLDLALLIARWHPATAVVMISGGPVPSHMPPGALFLAKPVADDTLLRTVCCAIDGKALSKPPDPSSSTQASVQEPEHVQSDDDDDGNSGHP